MGWSRIIAVVDSLGRSRCLGVEGASVEVSVRLGRVSAGESNGRILGRAGARELARISSRAGLAQREENS